MTKTEQIREIANTLAPNQELLIKSSWLPNKSVRLCQRAIIGTNLTIRQEEDNFVIYHK
jgi:hypothetical protein